MKVTMGTMSRSVQYVIEQLYALSRIWYVKCVDHKDAHSKMLLAMMLGSLPKSLQVFILWSRRSHNGPVCATMRHS